MPKQKIDLVNMAQGEELYDEIKDSLFSSNLPDYLLVYILEQLKFEILNGDLEEEE